MWDLVGNPEDRFSHNEAHLDQLANLHFVSALVLRADNHYENMPMQYTAIFHGSKNEKFQIKD